MLVKKNIDLAPYTTFRLSARAEFFAMVKNESELIGAVNWAKAKKLPLNFLAGGSNILIVKKKIKGLVIKISGEKYSIKNNLVTCWTGTGLTKLSLAAASLGLGGLEWACGIPGSIGGAVRGNAGAYGSAIADAVLTVKAYDLIKSKAIELDNRTCNFAYRDSVFKRKNNLLITEIKLRLIKDSSLGEIKKLSEANFRHRFETKPKQPSAGCVFKNLEYNKLIKQNKALARELINNGRVRDGKIATGYLIDQLDLRGKFRGGAKVSEQHANFIINTGKAEAKDIIYLINLIKKKVKNKYKINLEEEIQYLGS
jgi:UDP-N-acetylmuramate dehydrogenase